MPSTYSTDTLVGVIADLKRAPKWLLDRFFTKVSQDESEEIHFDVILGKRRIAPFCSPLVAGKVVQSKGREVRSFRPAYVKDKRRFNPSEAFKRSVGEKIGGSLSATQRRDAYLAAELADQIDMLDRRMEVMASEAIRTGMCTVEGEDYPTQVVDFRRAAALTPAALAGTARWGQADDNPLKNLKDWKLLVLKESGVAPVDVIMGVDAYEEFSSDTKVEKRLDTRNITNASLAGGTIAGEGGTFMGTIDGFNIFAYGGWYVDPLDGVEKEIFPAGQIAMTSPLVEGVRAHGAIVDADCLQALPYFPKMWKENDPGVEWLMLQSSPLTVPSRPDATLGVQVLG